MDKSRPIRRTDVLSGTLVWLEIHKMMASGSPAEDGSVVCDDRSMQAGVELELRAGCDSSLHQYWVGEVEGRHQEERPPPGPGRG